MLPDIGFIEMALIAVIALLIIGPKDLPKAIRTVTSLVGRVRGLAREFRESLDEIVEESQLRELRDEIVEEIKLDVDRLVSTCCWCFIICLCTRTWSNISYYVVL